MVNAVVPLESNPEVFTKLAYDLGLSKDFAFTDVYSISDPVLLAMVERPVKALILLFPVSENYELQRKEVDSGRVPYEIPSSNEQVYWFPQLLKNACGLYALLHSVVNASGDNIVAGSKLEALIQALDKDKTFQGRTDIIENLEFEYSRAARSGQTRAPDPQENVDLHFISFVLRGGHVYELDGRRNGPIDLGASSSDDILEEQVVFDRVQNLMSLADEKNKLLFSLMALNKPY